MQTFRLLAAVETQRSTQWSETDLAALPPQRPDFTEIFMRTPTLPQRLERGPAIVSETNNNYFKGSDG